MPSAKPLEGKHIAILAEDLYEDLELWYPLLRLREAGAETSGGGARPRPNPCQQARLPGGVDKFVQETSAPPTSTPSSSPAATPRTACAATPPWWPWSGRRSKAARWWPPSAMPPGCWPPPRCSRAGPSPAFRHQGRPGPCRGPLPGRRSGGGRQPHHLPAARRSAGLLPRHHRRPGRLILRPHLPDSTPPGSPGPSHPYWDRPWDMVGVWTVSINFYNIISMIAN